MHVLKSAQAKNIVVFMLWLLIGLAASAPLSSKPASLGMDSLGSQRTRRSSVLFLNSWGPSNDAEDTKFTSLPEVSPIDTLRINFKRASDSGERDNVNFVKGMMASNEDGETNSHLTTEVNDGSNTDLNMGEGLESDADAFSVKIDGVPIYGGLITYSHSQHPAQICRVMNACLRKDGTLLLPEWMQRHDTILNFHCGQSKLEFSLSDTFVPAELKNADLVGLEYPRPSMPHFLEDFMSNTVIFDLVYGDHQVSKSCHSRKGKDCDIFPGLSQGFRPAVLLPSRLQELKKNSWVRQFIKLMKPRDIGKQATLLFNTESDESSQCFKSAFFTRGPYNKNVIMADHLRNIHFLDLNGIGKKPRNAVKTTFRGESEQNICDLNVTLSNRKLVDGARNRLIGRYMMNIPELRTAIVKQAKRIPGLKLNVETMTLEGRSLWWQINGMQKTDIWVAGHSPLLTNMLFLRENSTVVEVQPFSYYPQTYERMALRLAHVQYDRYIAHPDLEGFEKCIQSLYPKKHRSYEKATKLLEKFSKAAQKYEQSDSTHSLTLTNFNDTSLRYVTKCAQMQRLDTNAKNLAIAIVRHARLRCGFPKPPLKKMDRN